MTTFRVLCGIFAIIQPNFCQLIFFCLVALLRLYGQCWWDLLHFIELPEAWMATGSIADDKDQEERVVKRDWNSCLLCSYSWRRYFYLWSLSTYHALFTRKRQPNPNPIPMIISPSIHQSEPDFSAQTITRWLRGQSDQRVSDQKYYIYSKLLQLAPNLYQRNPLIAQQHCSTVSLAVYPILYTSAKNKLPNLILRRLYIADSMWTAMRHWKSFFGPWKTCGFSYTVYLKGSTQRLSEKFKKKKNEHRMNQLKRILLHNIKDCRNSRNEEEKHNIHVISFLSAMSVHVPQVYFINHPEETLAF